MSVDGRPSNDVACRRILRTKDHYDTLEVSRQADEATVKAAFRRKAREVHPDKNASPLAGDAFKRLQKASDVLLDAQTRRRYDMFGDDEPCKPQQPVFRHQNGYTYHYQQQGGYGGSPLPSMLPFVVTLMFASLLLLVIGGILESKIEKSHRTNSKKGSPEPPFPVHLTRTNADVTCGATGKPLCVILLTDPSKKFGEREVKVLEKIRMETDETVKNVRGQRMAWTWATAVAGPRWLPFLPETATFPWVVVLKPTRAGLRLSCMPVPKAGGKEQGRLSKGVPRLLQEISSGSAKFEPVKGNVTALFGGTLR